MKLFFFPATKSLSICLDEVLSDEKKRKLYDQVGEKGMKEGAGAGGFHGSDPFDIFNMFFGGGGGSFGGSRQENRGKDLVHQLGVSLEDLYNGAVRKLALQKNVICDKCEGKLIRDSFSKTQISIFQVSVERKVLYRNVLHVMELVLSFESVKLDRE